MSGRGRPKGSRNIIPVIGARYGSRTILREVEPIDIHTRVEVQCDCGHIGRTAFYALRRGMAQHCHSCGGREGVDPAVRASRAEAREKREALAVIKEEATNARKASIRMNRTERRQRVESMLATGMSKTEAAAYLGVSPSLITRIVQGTR